MVAVVPRLLLSKVSRPPTISSRRLRTLEMPMWECSPKVACSLAFSMPTPLSSMVTRAPASVSSVRMTTVPPFFR